MVDIMSGARMMRRLIIVCLVVFFTPCLSMAADDSIPKTLVFPNSKGQVVFNHEKHVKEHKNCKTCHDRKGGKIKGLGKKWAHKVCWGCHEAVMLGPRSNACEQCHDLSKIKGP
jgi:predicted CXXCH cytochrome family protein